LYLPDWDSAAIAAFDATPSIAGRQATAHGGKALWAGLRDGFATPDRISDSASSVMIER